MVTAGLSQGRVGLEELCCSSQRQQPQVWWLHSPLALHTQLAQKLGSGSVWQEAWQAATAFVTFQTWAPNASVEGSMSLSHFVG